MTRNWSGNKRILCIRPDNMGDLLMSSPAIKALKQSLGCHITVLTSTVAAGIASFIPEIDQVINFDFPWLKNDAIFNVEDFNDLIDKIQLMHFDAAVIFSVYSQNPLPSAMIAFMAGIPNRLAYCRENPYTLLTDWVPEKEPYSFVRHQVQRDLDLVAAVGATTDNPGLSLNVSEEHASLLNNKLRAAGVNLSRPWLLLHPGVSEVKRQFPGKQWVALAKNIIREFNYQVIFTGGPSESELVMRLVSQTGDGAYSIAGGLTLAEFVILIKRSPLVISVNTGTIHIASATGTPVIVLYALTNPQHSPWQAIGKIFPFKVSETLQSKNEVIRYVSKVMNSYEVPPILPEDIMSAVRDLLSGASIAGSYTIPELIHFPARSEQVL